MKNCRYKKIIFCLLLLAFLNALTIYMPSKSKSTQNDDLKLNAGEITTNNLMYKDIIVPKEIVRLIHVELEWLRVTEDWFFFTFKIGNESGHEIWPTIEVLWNGTNEYVRVERSRSLLNVNSYTITVPAIFVLEGEAPIILNMTITRDGYQDKYYEAKIAIDPATVEKNGGSDFGEFTLPLIITISIVSSGAVIGLIGLYWFKLRK